MMLVGILPTISDDHLNGEALSANPRYKLLNEQIFAARGEDLQISITGPGAAEHVRGHDRARGRVHERAAAPAGRPRALRHALERRAGDRRRAARGRRELAVLLRPRAVAGDADRALRAGHRHAPGGAQGPGRAPARVVRRALDHLDLRPLRGERHLLPRAAAGVRAGGPGRGARRRRRALSSPSCASTTARSTAGTGRSTTSCAASRTCASRTACCPPARPSSTRSPTPPSTTGSCRQLAEEDRPIWSRMSFSAAEENFHAGARDGIDATRVLARARRGAGVRARAAAAAPARPRGARAAGGRRRPTATACSASSRRAAPPSATARPGRPRRSTALRRQGPRARAGAARDDGPLPRPHARQRAGPRLARRLSHS